MTSSDAKSVISAAGRWYLHLHLAPGIGPVRARSLVKHFGSPQEVLSASRSALEKVAGIGPQAAESIVAARDESIVQREVGRASDLGARILCIEDEDYPALLQHTTDPPICLYIRGDFEPADAVALAIVGTRRCSHYGKEQALRFGHAIAHAGFTVVSGLARGVDGHAHRGAMQADGRTIAVLGGGLGHIFPKEHESLAGEIAQRCGAVITEYPVDVTPIAGNFPNRNRIIAGLSLGVLVVEAGRRSGALITARLATESGREVFAVPGRVDQPEVSEGVNGLIRECAAKLVTSITDILDDLGDVGRIMGSQIQGDGGLSDDGHDGQPVARQLPPQEAAVVRALADGHDGIDRIAEVVGCDLGRVNTILASLQLKGLVTRLPGNRYVPRR